MPDSTQFQEQLNYLGAELQRLEGKLLTAQETSDAVANGMKQAVSSPEFWDAGLDGLGKRTRSAAGGFLLEGMWGVLRRVAWFLAAGFAVYILGGWSALVSLFKLMFADFGAKP